MITFNEFLKKVDDTFLNHQAARSGGKIKAANQWRYGQTVMNVLWDVWPEKYQQIHGSDCDCFYDNVTVQHILDKLEKEWIV
jgi:hypothetical protein